MARFSKLALLAYLTKQMEYLGEKRGFDPSNGWAQVEGKGEEANRDFGAYFAYKRLYMAVDFGFMKPFSRNKVLENTLMHATTLQRGFGFTTATGYAQVQGKGEEKNRAYGEWDALNNLHENIISGYVTL